jgi:uncharacterized membrane protein
MSTLPADIAARTGNTGRSGSQGAALLLALSYPLTAHLAVLSGRAGLIAASLGLLVVLGLLPALRRRSLAAWILLIGAVAGVVFVATTRSALLLLFVPPVLINGLMAWVFGRTLSPGRTPLIEILVRLIHGPQATLDDEILTYARRLTAAWTALFIVLGTTNFALALLAEPAGLLVEAGLRPPVTVPLQVWSLFANVLNYVIVGAFFAVEFFLRRRRFPQQGYRGLVDFTRRVASLGSVFRPTGN